MLKLVCVCKGLKTFLSLIVSLSGISHPGVTLTASKHNAGGFFLSTCDNIPEPSNARLGITFDI